MSYDVTDTVGNGKFELSLWKISFEAWGNVYLNKFKIMYVYI